MYSGYLSIEVHPARPGEIRVRIDDRAPVASPEGPEGPKIVYTAQFSDIDAARMHAHQALHNHMLDLESRRYQAEPRTIIAALEAETLKHERVYIDADLEREISSGLKKEVAHLQMLSTLRDKIWHIVGAIGIGILIFNMLFNSGLG